MTERRREPRFDVQLAVRVWGNDSLGKYFEENAATLNISFFGALLLGITHPLKPGDDLNVQYQKTRARFKVMWARDFSDGRKLRVALLRYDAEPCPWEHELLHFSERPAAESFT